MNEALPHALDRAARLMRMEAYDQAIEAWRDVLTMTPDLAEAHAGLAMALVQRKRLVAAQIEAERALEGDAQCIQAMLALALCDYFDNHRKRALKRLDEMLALSPLYAEAHYLHALLLHDMRQWNSAEGAIAKALELEPDNAAYRLELGRIARERGDPARADSIARELVGRDPLHVGALVLLGNLARDAGDIDEAYKLALSALNIDASDNDALTLLAGVKLSRNPIGGLFWHTVRKLQRFSLRQLAWVVSGIYLGYLMILTTMAHLRVPLALQYVFIALYLAWGIGVWVNRNIVDRMVRRELQGFRWQDDY